MTSAGEVFVVQLARASRKANRYIRHLQRADREDVIAAAILWCWENRRTYGLTTTLDTWFVGAVRNAYRDWLRGEEREASDLLSEIPTGDTTLAHVEALEAATTLVLALPSEYKKAATLLAQGYTRAEIMERGISHDTLYETRARIKQLRRLLPDDHEYRQALRTAPAVSSDDASDRLAPIDVEMSRLEAMPKHGQDCPPCWRCKWFDGYMPGAYKSIRMPIQEPEVRDAVRDTEARKITIAQQVRWGSYTGVEMGIYEYQCDCGRIMELMVKLEEKPAHLNCDTCRGIAKPILSATPTTFRANDRKAFKRQGH